MATCSLEQRTADLGLKEAMRRRKSGVGRGRAARPSRSQLFGQGQERLNFVEVLFFYSVRPTCTESMLIKHRSLLKPRLIYRAPAPIID